MLFAITNDAAQPMPLRQEDFRLRIAGTRRIAPALPGRAASLLRDKTGSDQATLAGALVFGLLAAPSIHAAQQEQHYATSVSRELLFASAELAPGQSSVGYLIFESPLPVDAFADPVLELTCASATMELPLHNPYYREESRRNRRSVDGYRRHDQLGGGEDRRARRGVRRSGIETGCRTRRRKGAMSLGFVPPSQSTHRSCIAPNE